MNEILSSKQAKIASKPPERQIFERIELFNMQRVITGHRDILEELYQDMSEAYQPIYILDFQEIYSYIFPFSDDATDTVTTNYVLDNLSDPFILLSGTWYELLYKLQGVVNDVDRLIYALKSEDIPSKLLKSLEYILKSDRHEFLRKDVNFQTNLKEESIQVATALSKFRLTFTKLVTLLTRENHKSLQDLAISSDAIKVDQDLVDKFEKALEVLSSGRSSHSNRADAVNLAGIVAIRQYMNRLYRERTDIDVVYRTLYRPFLLSHTPSLLNIESWAVDLLGRWIGGDLVRTPDMVLYHLVNTHSTTGDTQESIHVRINLCNNALERIREFSAKSLSDSSAPNLLSLPKPIQELGLPKAEVLAITSKVHDIKDISQFIDLVHDPIIGKITAIRRRNRLSTYNRQIQSFAGFHDNNSVNDDHVTAIKELKALTWQAIDNSPSHDLEASNMRYEEKDLIQIECTRIGFYLNTTEDVVFMLDKYPSFYSAYWPTTDNLQSFFELIITTVHELHTLAKTKYIKKIRVYLMTDRTLHEREVSLSRLATDPLESLVPIEEDEIAMYVRIVTFFGDFCYEIQPRAMQDEMHMGFISKYKLTDTLSELFYKSCNQPMLVPLLLTKHIKSHMESYLVINLEG